MRPRLRDDVRYVPCDEGAYVHADHGACTLKGAQAHEWLEKLVPYLTGEHRLAELTAGLPADRRRMVVSLVETLAAHGFVVDAADEEPHGLSAYERRIYAAEIAFIRYRLASAERRFERLRQARITLAGHGPVLAALLEAGLVSGWRHVRVVSSAGEAANLEQVAARARRDEEQRVRVDTEPLSGDADVLLQVGADVAGLLATAQACAADVVLGQILLCPSEAWIVGPGTAAAAVSCWRRLAGLPYGDADDDGTNLLTGPVPAVLAAQPVLSCFARLTGLAESREHLTASRVDLHTLETRRHRVVPWTPGARRGATSDEGRTSPAVGLREAGLRTTVERLQAGAPMSAEALLERATQYVDARTGLLSTLDEENLVQVPVPVCRATVSDPRRTRPGWAPAPQVVGWGRDRRTARVRAVLAACATYGALAAADAETWGPETWGPETWGIELLTGRTRQVPAISAAAAAGWPGRPPIGVGAGLSWATALASGLRSHAEALQRTHAEALLCSHAEALLSTHATADVRVPPEGMADSQVVRLLELLRTAGEQPEVRDLTGVLRLPAYAVACGSAVSVACATTPVQALRDAVERALLAWQARAAGQAAYADPVPLWWAGEEPPECEVLAEALQRAGQVPVAVPLHHDAAAAELLPYVVRVVLCDD